MKKTYELFVIVLVLFTAEVGVWWWGYWVGKNDTLALQVISNTTKEMKK